MNYLREFEKHQGLPRGKTYPTQDYIDWLEKKIEEHEQMVMQSLNKQGYTATEFHFKYEKLESKLKNAENIIAATGHAHKELEKANKELNIQLLNFHNTYKNPEEEV